MKIHHLRYTHVYLLLLLAIALQSWSQSDPLVSKSIPHLLTDNSLVWALHPQDPIFSVVDPFEEPPSISNGSVAIDEPLMGGAGRQSSVVAFFNAPWRPAGGENSMLARKSGLAWLQRGGASSLDTLAFSFASEAESAVLTGVEFTSLSITDSMMALGAGRAGFALLPLRRESEGLLQGTSLDFHTLRNGTDSSFDLLRCQWDAACRIDTLVHARVQVGGGPQVQFQPDSVTDLALDRASADSLWVLVGTNAGLRRGLAGSGYFPLVTQFPESDTNAVIRALFVNPDTRVVWAVTPSRLYVSTNGGASFHFPPSVPQTSLTPRNDLIDFTSVPTAAFLEDSTFLNLKLRFPGLVVFQGDSLRTNEGPPGTLSGVILGPEDGLSLRVASSNFTDIVHAYRPNRVAQVLGTTGEGILFRVRTNGVWGPWKQENRLRVLAGGLDKVITFPTLFTGEEDVRVGYRLDRNADVSITVYNYAMEKVRSIVSGSPRMGGGSVRRSEDPSLDRWDGRDDSGRYVSVGTYYVLVKSSDGDTGWGKVLVVRGRDD